MVFLTGLATNIFMFFLARFGAGISQASTYSVHGSLLADTYPISLRGRIYAAMGIATGIATALSPILVGTIATRGRRSERVALGLLHPGHPDRLVAIIAFRLAEPPRGQHEKLDVLGEVISDTQPVPPSLEAAFARIMRIRTLKMVLIAFSAMGFGLFTAPVLGNLFLQAGVRARRVPPRPDRHHRQRRRARRVALRRSLLRPALPEGPGPGTRRSSARSILPVAVIVPIQYFMPNAVLWACFSVLATVLSLSAFSMVGPVLTSVAPYHLRGMTGAVGAIYLFFIGATGGAVLSAGCSTRPSAPGPPCSSS